jgi:TonB family protein
MVLRFALLLFLLAITLAVPARADPDADTPGENPTLETEVSAEQEAMKTSPAVGSKAKLLKPGFLAYPAAASQSLQDGWVELSFSVTPEGNVADPIVEDSSGVADFERAAISSVLKSRYSPATWNGQPVEQCATKLRIIFSIGRNPRHVARPAFAKRYREVVALADEQRTTEAETRLEELTAKGTWTNYEASKLWLLRATMQSSNGDQLGALRSFRRAQIADGIFVDPQYYPKILRFTFGLEVELRQFGAALATYSKLRKLESAAHDPELDKVAHEIEQAIDGPDVLAFPGVIEYRSGCKEGRPNWQHELLRRKFTFDNIEGLVDDFELRCDWKRVVDKVSTEKVWEVPDDWGWCQVFVFGETGAKVKIIEYPLAESQRGIRRQPVLTDLND